jgi:S1-C subfamily serine protease
LIIGNRRLTIKKETSMSVLADLSNDLATAVSNASPSVVRVEGRRRIPATGIIWSANGHIITAHHVAHHDEAKIGLPDGSTVSTKLVGRDATTDIAILKADITGLAAFTEANKQELGVGHLVLALGRPGKTVQATLGIISALGESWRTQMGGLVDRYVQTDVVMYPGFSGGPLIDANGRLVGLNTSALGGGVSIAIPTQTLSRVADSLLAHGKVKRGYLGVSTQQARIPEGLRSQLDGQKRGLLIISVEGGSPAEKGGLTLGDTILGIAGVSVHNHDDLLATLTGDQVGTAVPVKILRGGQIQMVDVTIGERG